MEFGYKVVIVSLKNESFAILILILTFIVN